MSFTRKKNLIPTSYVIDSIPVNRVQTKKDLGVIFTNNLCFNTHINNTVQSANKTLGFIMRTLHSTTDLDPFLLLFKSLVLSKLNYASVVWMPHTDENKHLIDSVQAVFCRRLFHRINGFYPSYPENIAYSDLRENLNLCSVENGQKKILLQFLYKVLNNNIDSIQLVQDIPFQVPLSLTRNINNVHLFKIPKATITQLSPIFKALTLYNFHHHSQLDLFSIYSKFCTELDKIFN